MLLALLLAAQPAEPTEPAVIEAPPAGDATAEAVPTAVTDEPEAPAETVVRARQARQAASSSTVRDRDFALRPHPRPADLLSTVPGFYVVQHSGGGKANQYFLRGFDADHGTDVALSVDGVPVNLVSHGHGQGYADLSFVIPETISRLEVKKGPYFADTGDFATAGAVDLVTRGALEASSVSVGAGAYAAPQFFRQPALSSRVLLMTAPASSPDTLMAADVSYTDGPFENRERYLRFNLLAKVPFHLGDNGDVTATAMSSGGGWNGSGQLPLRAVEAGDLDRFSTVDNSEGGNSQRHSLSLRWRSPVVDGTSSTVLIYLVHQRFTLFSNFTFFSGDHLHGDEIEQTDVRTFGGGDARTRLDREVFGVPSTTEFGLQVRNDLIDNGLHRSERRERIGDVVDASVGEGSLGVFVDEELAFSRWLRVVVGARGDGFGFQVDDRLEDVGVDSEGGATSGVAFAGTFSPKASVIVSVPDVVDLYGNVGVGFHSNDARGVVREQDAVTPITRGLGGELGARSNVAGVDLAAAVFALGLEGETVWVGDEGTTELRGPTLRTGVELEARSPLGVDWLRGDVDVNWTRATFLETDEPVPLAPTLIVDGGVSLQHPFGWHGRLGAVYLGDRAAIEDESITAAGFLRLDGSLGFKNDSFAVDLDVQNLLNTEWREAQFANVSRLADEKTPADCGGRRAIVDGGAFAGCEDLHFTPGAPLNGRVTVTLFF